MVTRPSQEAIIAKVELEANFALNKKELEMKDAELFF